MFYLYIVHNSPFLCVWRWSDNLLSGSKWCDRWARRCLDLERGLAWDVL